MHHSSIKTNHSLAMVFRKLKHVQLFGAMLIVVLSTAAQAQIVIDRSVIDLWQPGQEEVITIRNSTVEDIQLQTALYEVTDPHINDENRVPLALENNRFLSANIDSNSIPAGGQSIVSLSSLVEGDATDRIFRLKISPMAGTVNVGAIKKSTAIPAVKLLVAYELLIIVRAASPTVSILSRHENNSIVLKNHGNTAALVSPLDACEEDAAHCVEFKSNRLYAGEELRIDNDADSDTESLAVSASVFDGKKTKTFFWWTNTQ